MTNTRNGERSASVELKTKFETPLTFDDFHRKNRDGAYCGVNDFAFLLYFCNDRPMFFFGGVPYLFQDGVYKPDESGARLKSEIRDIILDTLVKAPTIKRIYDLIAGAAELQLSESEINTYPPEWICFKNGLYDTKSNILIPHSPSFKCTNQIDFNFNPYAKTQAGAFDEWLDFAVPNDADKMTVMQFFGLTLTRDTRFQKFLILNGCGGTGKSTLIRLIESIVGAENTAHTSLTELSERFATYGLKGKLLNTCADLETSALNETAVIKKLVGEDTIRAEKKGCDAIAFHNTARLIFSTNELPVVKGEKSDGFYRRLLVVDMNKKPKTVNPDLFAELFECKERIIWLAVQAVRRLYADGHFCGNENSDLAVQRLRCDSDTVEAFIYDACEETQNTRTERQELFNAYQRYCWENERTPLTKNNFFKSLRLKGISEVVSHGCRYFKIGCTFLKKSAPKMHPNEQKCTPSDVETLSDELEL